MAKYVKTEQGYVDTSIFAPAQFKPEGKSYLTFSSPKNFTLEVNNRTKNWNGTLEYFASDKTWTVWDGMTTLSAVDNDGDYVLYLRGTGNTVITGNSENYRWVLTGTDIKCIGNIENLLDYAAVASREHPTMANSCYAYMFQGCTSLTQAPALPATTLSSYCYQSMFRNCTSLTQAPALPATTLSSHCYHSMFENCTSLTQAPVLPATTLANDCYYQMFQGCTSLTKAPALPATTLSSHCYSGMFHGCTSLTQAPALPATTLTDYCYYYMFSGCASLTQVPALPATNLVTYCYNSMFKDCTGLKLSSTQTNEYTIAYRIPTEGNGRAAENHVKYMFTSTGGTFTGTPAINTTYYLSIDNMIVRDTEVATLNGYVGSMIDKSVSNPLNITGATVGQIAKITAVDESGKPTSWEAVDIYDKPASGIPKSDLADNVQTSLAKADTAISYDSQTLTEAQQKQARTNIGAGQPIFVVNVTDTLSEQGDEVYTADKTAAEIETAYQEGCEIVCRMSVPIIGMGSVPVQLPLASRRGRQIFMFAINQTMWTDKSSRIVSYLVTIADDGVNVGQNNTEIYIKPTSGIPKTDLADDVQTSLAKADTAISLGLTAATPGQIIKVKTVQDGKPTEWEAVDMPSGGVEWYEVIDMETTENVNDLIISTDKNGRPISGYHALAMVLCFMIPADSTQTSGNGSIWAFPMSYDNLSSAVRTVITVSGWKTVTRTYNFLYAGSNRALFVSGAPYGTVFDGSYNNVFDGIRLFINNAGDHLPTGTKVRCLVLSKGWTA